MNNANPLAAELLERSAAGYASAANALLQKTPDLGAEFARASTEWKAHFQQRILELAAAIRVDRPELFVRRIQWLRRAIRARGADEREIRIALESLRAALELELPDQIKSSVEQPIRLALDMLDAEIEPEIQSLDRSTPLGNLGLKYLAACLEGRTCDATKLVWGALDSNATPQEVYTELLLPAQREVGQLWHSGDVSVSEERLVSETTRELMTLIVHRFARESDPRLTVLAASVAGNAHDIGLRAVADLFRLAGWHVLYLGADMPTAEIARAARSFDANLVVLSATLTTQINTLSEAIEQIKQMTDAPPILVGGLALEDNDELWRRLGADAYSPDAASAVSVGARLIANSS
jgi:methanogenic corrinoid protein MtbC1